MPPPYSMRHNGYLKAYQTTGARARAGRAAGTCGLQDAACAPACFILSTCQSRFVIHTDFPPPHTLPPPPQGKNHILDRMVEVVAIHKDRHIMPVTLGVVKASGSGADATFMSVIKVGAGGLLAAGGWGLGAGMGQSGTATRCNLHNLRARCPVAGLCCLPLVSRLAHPPAFPTGPAQPAAMSADDVKAWMLPNGGILSVDQGFVDYTGWTIQDLVGKTLSMIAADPGEVERYAPARVKGGTGGRGGNPRLLASP
jgi:hypothetical protein